MESSVSLESFQTIDGHYDPALTNTNVEWLKENMNHVNYEPRKTKKKPTTKKDVKGTFKILENIGVETDDE